MAFAFKIRFVWYCLCLVYCISGNTIAASFEIQRGKVDTFTNSGCQKSNNCTEKGCAVYEAKCVDDKCERCRCKEDSATFLARNTTTIITYKCVKNENIIPDSDLQFRLEKINKTDKRTNQCLTVVAVEQNYKIFGKGCNSSLNMHWIWTKNQQKIFLMNLMTLQCLEFLQCNQNTTEVVLKQCKKTDRRQYISVKADSPGRIFSKCDGKNYFLRLEEQESNVGYSSFGERIVGRSLTKDLDRWTNSKKDDLHLSNPQTTYNGCYRFQNEKFMLYLDRKTCPKNPCSHEFFAPIFYENANCDVIWSESKILYGDNVQWQNISSKENNSMSISEKGNHESSNIKMLKVYQNALNIFHGSLVRLAISCRNKMKENQKSVENQCLLLKFKSVSSTEEEILTKTPSPALTTTLTPRSTIQKTSLTKSSINTIAIAVPVSLLAVILVLTLFYFMCYRKHKKTKQLSENQGENLNNPSYTIPVYEDPTRVYETLASPAGEQKDIAPAKYEYIDNNGIIAKTKQPQPELKYDYATNTEVVNTVPKSNAGQPELEYDYATNTDIPKITLGKNPETQCPAGQPELKYDYAIKTEIPRVNLDTLPKVVADQPKLKYDYATDTEIPKIDLNLQPKSDDSVDPSGSAMYHTLEEPNPPEYSTLEEPTAETSPLVTYDTRHSGDPMYHVLEDSNHQNSQP